MKHDIKLLHDAAAVAAAAMLNLRATPPEDFSADDLKELFVIAELLMETRRRCYTLAATLTDGKPPPTPRWDVGKGPAIPSRIVSGKTRKQVLAERKHARLARR